MILEMYRMEGGVEFRKGDHRTKLYRFDAVKKRRSMVGSISNDVVSLDELDPDLRAALTPAEEKQLAAWLKGARPRVARETAAELVRLAERMAALADVLPPAEKQELYNKTGIALPSLSCSQPL